MYKYMLDFSNYSQKYTHNWNIKNSLVSYLTPNKNEYLKSNNFIKGFYKDTILKDFIYVSSSGFKNDTFIRKNRILKNIINSEDFSFVSFFTMKDSKIFQLNLFSFKYYNVLSKNNIDKEKKIYKYLLWDYNKNKYSIDSDITNDSIGIDYKYNYNKLIFLKSQWKKLTVVTDTGLIRQINPTFYSKICFTGLISILPESAKNSFINVLYLNYLLLDYFSNIILTEKNNNNLLYIVNLYYSLYKFFNIQFFDYFKSNKISLRKSNKFLNKYIIFFKNKINYLIEKCKNLVYSKLLVNNLQNTWLNWFLFNHTNNIEFLNYNKDTINNRLSNFSLSEKTTLFKYISYILQLSLFDKISNSNLDIVTSFEKYFILKSYLTFQNIKAIFNSNVFLNNFLVKFPNYELTLFLLKRINTNDIYNESLKFADSESFDLSTIHLKKVKYYNFLLEIFKDKLLRTSEIRLFKKNKDLIKFKKIKKKRKLFGKVNNYKIKVQKRVKLNTKLKSIKLDKQIKIKKLNIFVNNIDSNLLFLNEKPKISKSLVSNNSLNKLLKKPLIYKVFKKQKQLILQKDYFFKQINGVTIL